MGDVMDEREPVQEAINRAAERLKRAIAKRDRLTDVVVPWMRRP